MTNPHIIVDPATRRCLCGVYNGMAHTCQDFLDIIARMTTDPNVEESKTAADGYLLKAAFEPLIEDRP